MSYLPYFCLFPYSGVQHILCCDFDLFYYVLCTLCCLFLWIVQFWLLLRYSLPFIFHQYQQSEQLLLTSTNWTVVIFVIGLWWTSNKTVYWSNYSIMHIIILLLIYFKLKKNPRKFMILASIQDYTFRPYSAAYFLQCQSKVVFPIYPSLPHLYIHWTLSYETLQGDSEIWSHKAGGRLIQV